MLFPLLLRADIEPLVYRPQRCREVDGVFKLAAAHRTRLGALMTTGTS